MFVTVVKHNSRRINNNVVGFNFAYDPYTLQGDGRGSGGKADRFRRNACEKKNKSQDESETVVKVAGKKVVPANAN